MTGVALKGLMARKVRALLTALAVVIGVSMVSGTLILTDTMQGTFDGLFAASYDKTDAVIEARQIVEKSTSGSATIPETLLTEVRALPEVEAASGTVSPTEVNAADIIGRDGKAVAKQSMGLSIDPANVRFSPLKLKLGDWPQGPGQVVVDAGTAGKNNYKVGDSVKIATPGKTASYQITGTASYGGVDSLGFGSIAVWDVKTAQDLLEREGRFDTISIAAKDGTSPAELVSAVRPLVADPLEVKDGAQQAKEAAEDANNGLNYIRYFLLGFGGIALFVGAFVIFNTLSITVAQRTREFATLRTLGASRKQVLRSVRLEGLMIGLLASTIGLLLGFGIAKGLLVLFSAMGVDLPEGKTVFAFSTVLISLVVGTAITLLATIVPARRATRVPPIAAVREGSTLPASRFAAHSRRTGLGVLLASRRSDRGRVGRLQRPARRRRRLHVVPRPRAPGAASGQAARLARRLAGASRRRRRRRTGPGQRRPQPGTHRVDGCRAHDRAHARDGRRGARSRPEQLDQVRDHRPASR